MTFTPKTCQICNRKWMPTTRYQATRNKTCSRACAGRAVSQAKKGKPTGWTVERITLTCPVCDKRFQRRPKYLSAMRVKTPTCSKQCNGKLRAKLLVKFSGNMKGRRREPQYGVANPAWKGGVTTFRKKGNYADVKYVRAPAWALPMARKDGYIMEHRLLMAQRVGRLLARTEVVHHLDHNPLNNDLTNLELWPTNGSHRAAEGGRLVPGAANRVSLAA